MLIRAWWAIALLAISTVGFASEEREWSIDQWPVSTRRHAGSHDYLESPFAYLTGTFTEDSRTETTTEFGRQGLPVQHRHLIVQVEPNATDIQIKELLVRHELRIVAGVAQVGLLVVALPEAKIGTEDKSGKQVEVFGQSEEASQQIWNMMQLLSKNPIVRAVAPNTVLGTAGKPIVSGPPSVLNPTTGQRLGWKISLSSVRSGGGNAWSEMRFPQAWNFNRLIRKRNRKGPLVAIVDAGFGPHDDLQFDFDRHQDGKQTDSTHQVSADHGTHVLGIISSKRSGGAPFARLLAVPTVASSKPNQSQLRLPPDYVLFSDVVEKITSLMNRREGEPRIVNVSLAYNWRDAYGCNPNKTPEIQEIVRNQGRIMGAVAELAAKKGTIIVSPAGNDSLSDEKRRCPLGKPPELVRVAERECSASGSKRNRS